MTNSPVILHPINGPVTIQLRNSALLAQNLQPTPAPVGQIGQSLESELEKPLKPKLGPQPDVPELPDVVQPPLAPKEQGQPTKGQRSKTEPPMDATQRLEHAPPAHEIQPLWWPTLPLPLPLAVPAPAIDGTLPVVPTTSSSEGIRGEINNAPGGLAALAGVVAVASGIHPAMWESQRFKMRLLPYVAAPRSPEPARPRLFKR